VRQAVNRCLHSLAPISARTRNSLLTQAPSSSASISIVEVKVCACVDWSVVLNYIIYKHLPSDSHER
jgi:hypothetical protein